MNVKFRGARLRRFLVEARREKDPTWEVICTTSTRRSAESLVPHVMDMRVYDRIRVVPAR